MNNGATFLSSDSEMASEIKKKFVKNCHAMFDKKMKINCLSLIMALYKFSVISTSSSSYCRYSNQCLGSMNKCLV